MTAAQTAAAVAVTASDVSWMEAYVAVLLMDDAIANGAYVLIGDAGEMTALSKVSGDAVMGTAVTAATTYLYSRRHWQHNYRASLQYIQDSLCLFSRCRWLRC